MRRIFLSLFAVCGFSLSAQAATVTYTDRTAFENALSSFTVDSLDGITQYYHSSDARLGYSIASPSMYGCINHAGCGNNSSIGFDNSYLWHYTGDDVFTFDTAINGFGFDFNSPVGYGPISPIVQGITAMTTSGFFGIISDEAFNTVTVNQTSSYMLMDNVTFGGADASVPVPATLPMLLAALLGGASIARRSRG